MVETIATAELSVHETLLLQKNRLAPATGDLEGLPRLAIVTGIHGDELEGQYICYELQRRIHEAEEHLTGIVDIYPAVNPLGLNAAARSFPPYGIDMNRVFPGDPEGPLPEYLAHQLLQDLDGADCAVDLHASNTLVREAPQIRLNENMADRLMPYAERLGAALIWQHASATVLESTLAYALNKRGVPTLVVETGLGLRISPAAGDKMVDGLFNLMHHLGIWNGEPPAVAPAVQSRDSEVVLLTAEQPGLFLPAVPHGAQLTKGQPYGKIVDPLTGDIMERLTAPCDGWLFTLREYPLCTAGAMLGRILRKEARL